MAIIQIVLAVILLVSLPLWRLYHEPGQADTIITETGQFLFQLPGIASALLGFFCYCALEITAGLWGASYLVQTKGIAPDVAAGWISIYYLGITLGRFMNGFITAKFSNHVLIRGGQFIIGIGCAPIYPSMLHETPVRFGRNNSGKLIGAQMGFAYLGSTLAPPAFGLLSGMVGLRFYPAFILGLLIVMLVSNERINKIAERRDD